MSYGLPSIQRLDKMLQFPEINWDVETYPSNKTITLFRKITRKLNRRVQKMGYNDPFQKRLTEILEGVHSTDHLLGEIKTNQDIRVVIHLWRERDDFLERIPVSPVILTQFNQVRARLGLLALFHLAQLFFERFDACGDVQVLATYLCGEFGKHGSFFMEDMEHLRVHAHQVLSLQGPERIVHDCNQQNIELTGQLHALGIPEGQKGIYIDRCCQYRYIEAVKQMTVGAQSDIFDELTQSQIVNIPCEDQYLGHHVLRIMIEKGMAAGGMNEYWRSIILTIAGDPRSDRSDAYKRWWAQLPEPYVKAMLAWLAGTDIELFLEAMEHYAEIHYGSESQRTFPARAHFLQGLYKHGLITASRLFIGEEAGHYLHERREKPLPPDLAVLADSETSVIYLKVGNMHMLEGSHSFRLRLYEHLPLATHILDQDMQHFTMDDMGKHLTRLYKSEFSKKPFSVIHSPYQCRWQHEAMKVLVSRGVYVNPAWVLTTEDYKQYQHDYGIWMSQPETKKS